jgi:tryptophan synthase alpha chain
MMSNTAARVMTHMIAFYPDEERSLVVAEALADGGASYLEVQFPYSDPTADGPIIQKGCQQAIEKGFRKKAGFRLVEKIAAGTGIPLFIMSYAGLVVSGGTDLFVRQAKNAGASGVIVPDLTVGHDEGLYAAARREGLHCVPVIAPSVLPARVRMIADENPEYLYAALRAGVTGRRTDTEQAARFLEKVRPIGGKILAGFGIRERRQIEALAPCVHALVVGSAVIETTADAIGQTDDILYDTIRKKISGLVYGGGQEVEVDK